MVKPKSIDASSVDDTVKLTFTCPFCGAESTITVPYVGAVKYYIEGDLVQDAFPGLDADTREILVSGICMKCQSEVFGA